MTYDVDFSYYYGLVRPIVLRLHKLYHIKLWDRDDWEQEGMMVLYQLLSQYPALLSEDAKLRVYFKTKFSNYINDELRKQESQKRQFNKLAYEDITEVAHMVASRQMVTDELLVFQESLAYAKSHLNTDELEQMDELLTGRAFKGRTKLVRKLRVLMSA